MARGYASGQRADGFDDGVMTLSLSLSLSIYLFLSMPFFSQMMVERQSAPTHTWEVRTRRRGEEGQREGDSGLTLSFRISRGPPQDYRQQSLRQQYHAGRMMHPAELCSPLLPSSLEIQICTAAAQIVRVNWVQSAVMDRVDGGS